MIVDDDPAVTDLLYRVLTSHGYPHVEALNDPRRALSSFIDHRPDLVILDLFMPLLDGFTLTKQIRARVAEDEFLPILVLTGDAKRETKHRALSAGADDFLCKPFDNIELLLRVGHLMRLRALYLEIQHHKQRLEELVRERTRELEQARDEVLERLAIAAEHRDSGTAKHNERVALVTELLALRCGLPAHEARTIGRAALLHDLGKIGICDSLLHKEGQLSPEEYEKIKPHTVIGAEILSGSRSRILQIAELICLYHHERWDGSGYAGLKGHEIPLEARLVALADAFDAMTHDRPYRSALTAEAALAECTRRRGEQFDPALVDALIALHESGELERALQSRSAELGNHGSASDT